MLFSIEYIHFVIFVSASGSYGPCLRFFLSFSLYPSWMCLRYWCRSFFFFLLVVIFTALRQYNTINFIQSQRASIHIHVFIENFQHLVYLQWMKSKKKRKEIDKNRPKEMTTTMKKEIEQLVSMYMLCSVLCVWRFDAPFFRHTYRHSFHVYVFPLLFSTDSIFLVFSFLFFSLHASFCVFVWSDERLLSFHSFFKFNLLRHVWCDIVYMCSLDTMHNKKIRVICLRQFLMSRLLTDAIHIFYHHQHLFHSDISYL